jgi:predicted nucleic acid-binding protein
VGLLIDTSTLIAWERGQDDVAQRLATQVAEDSFVSVITASELLHGVHRAANAGVRSKRSAFVELLLDNIVVLPIDLMTARAHARLWAELAAAGTLIGVHDMWLAATCIAHGLTIITANVKDFERVPALIVQTWTHAS